MLPLARVWIGLCTSSIYMWPGAIYSCIYLWYKYLFLKNDRDFLESKIRLYSPEPALCKQLWPLKSSVCPGTVPLPSPKQLFLISDVCPWSIRENPLTAYNNLQQMNEKKENPVVHWLLNRADRARGRKAFSLVFCFSFYLSWFGEKKKTCPIPAFQSKSSVYLPPAAGVWDTVPAE